MTQRQTWFAVASTALVWISLCSCQGGIEPSESDSAALGAIKQLRKLSGAVRIGLNLEQYAARVIDMSAEVDASLLVIADDSVRQELEAAVEAYVDALHMWDAMATRQSLTINAASSLIIVKYNIPTMKFPNGRQELLLHGGTDGDIVYKREALSAIWTVAERHVARAGELVKKKPE
ncbi:MAG: hypothetical protein K8H99_11200 [Nitrospirae bacterium]|nr:hypothetical protein [Fimbriimonadaceae bacterium]